jgi:protease PrsW
MIPRILISLLPVLILALALLLLDSYKLVSFAKALVSLLKGVGAAVVALAINIMFIKEMGIALDPYSRYIAPIIEEAVKAAPLLWLIRKKRIGFFVDAAIHGAAIGAGFSILENISYLRLLSDSHIAIWFVRGFGTAVMHSSCTALFGILYKRISDQTNRSRWIALLPSFLAAALIHSFYNQFLLPPILTTIAIIIILPLLIVLVYENSERSLRSWLSMGMDEDMTMLEMILTGRTTESRFGQYLHSIRDFFPPTVVIDLFCYLRIYLELAIQAKGALLLRQYGLNQPLDPAIKEKFVEFKYLEKSIGKTGKLALAPFMRLEDRDLWQLYMLGDTASHTT